MGDEPSVEDGYGTQVYFREKIREIMKEAAQCGITSLVCMCSGDKWAQTDEVDVVYSGGRMTALGLAVQAEAHLKAIELQVTQ